MADEENELDRMRTEKADRDLTALLEDAANGAVGAVEQFFERLLSSEVYVGARFEEGAAAAKTAIVGQSKPADLGYLTVSYDGQECLPIFSERSFVAQWAEREVAVQRVPFRTLLWVLGDEMSMYLNANQEIGKELTSWEIEQLRKGVDAISELAAALEETPFDDVEVRSGRELYPELQTKLRSVLEIYPELEEAFLVAVKEGGSSDEKPMIGLRWSKGAPQAKKIYIRDELERVAKELLPSSVAAVFVVDDLDDPKSPNGALFEDAKPFYFAARQSSESAFRKAATSLLDVFGRMRGQSDTNEPEE